MKKLNQLAIAVFLLFSIAGCSDNNTTAAPTSNGGNGNNGGNNSSQLPAIFRKFANDINIYVDGQYVVLESKGMPEHTSPYWGSGHSLYESPHNGMIVNPNRIAEQDLVFRVPLNPQVANSITATSLGPMGISISGVPFFNQYAGPNEPLTREIATFDRYHGHPQQSGQYHYHIEPVYYTNDDDAFVGFLLDGFPVYGRKDRDGNYPQDLDSANGHFSVTSDYPDGIYHYHIIQEDPYISGGFRGTPGTVTQ